MTNECHYEDLLEVSEKIEQRQQLLSGYCVCYTELEASKLVLRSLLYGDVRRGNHHHTYITNVTANRWKSIVDYEGEYILD